MPKPPRKDIYTDRRNREHEVVVPVERPWGRRATLEKCQDILTNGFCVLEFGVARNPKGMNGDGWSTLFWSTLAKKLDGQVIGVDIDPSSVHFAQWLTKEYREQVLILEYDGYEFLETLKPLSIRTGFFPRLYFDAENVQQIKEYRIDFVYLDGPNDAKFHFDMLKGLWELDLYPHYILIDDVHPNQLQKGEKLMPYLDDHADVRQLWFTNGQALYEYTGDKHHDL